MTSRPSLGRQLGAEFVGSLLLATIVVGSGIAGAVLANVMFGGQAVSFSTHHRMSGPHFIAEIVATAGLVLIIFDPSSYRPRQIRPGGRRRIHRRCLLLHQQHQLRQPGDHDRAHVLRRFRRHSPSSAPGYISAQLIGGAVGFVLVRLFYPDLDPPEASTAILPNEATAEADRESSRSTIRNG